jgi:arylsulfatase A-like enzyme
MRPNVLFILVDGLRADQCYDTNRESHTPFLDSLINEGVYFNNTFSPADGTTISLNCLLNSKFQFETGIRAQKIILLEDNHLQKLKNSGYYIAGLIPKLTSLKPITDYFQNENHTYYPGPPPETLTTGITEKISLLLNSLKNTSPWFCYLHLFDLHPVTEGRKPLKIEEFQSEKFGNTLYEQTVSSIDYWLKKIFAQINFDNTLLIVTSDHGERIPFKDKSSVKFEPEFNSATSLGRRILPKSTHNVGGKIMGKLKREIGKTKLAYSNKELTPYQKRSREPKFTLSLHDELLHIPFLLKGLTLPSKIITNQISTLDIFPTIFELVGIMQNNTKYSSSLVPLINNQQITEKEIFLHTIPYEKESPLDKIGIRTSKYKYFRNSKNSKKDVNLYDLKNDPYENNNISKNNLPVIEKMEKSLRDMQNDTLELDNTLSKEEEEKISKELRKLGYIK